MIAMTIILCGFIAGLALLSAIIPLVMAGLVIAALVMVDIMIYNKLKGGKK